MNFSSNKNFHASPDVQAFRAARNLPPRARTPAATAVLSSPTGIDERARPRTSASLGRDGVETHGILAMSPICRRARSPSTQRQHFLSPSRTIASPDRKPPRLDDTIEFTGSILARSTSRLSPMKSLPRLMPKDDLLGTTMTPAFNNTMDRLGALGSSARSDYNGTLSSTMADRVLQRSKDSEMRQKSFYFKNKFFRYEGTVKHARQHGTGQFVMMDGSSIEGEFTDGEIIGDGVRRWPDGSSYMGAFRMGEMHGHGTYLGMDGSRYDGEHVYNVRCGTGTLRSAANNTVYTGDFRDNEPNGKGELRTCSFVCTGDFRRGVPHGDVDITYFNGDSYVGTASDGKPDGTGRFVCHTTRYAYEGPMREGLRCETPNAMVINNVIMDGKSLAPQLQVGDKFATIFLGHQFQIQCQIGKLTVVQPTVTPRAAPVVAAGGKSKGKPPTGHGHHPPKEKEVPKATVFDAHTSESGRAVELRGYSHTSGPIGDAALAADTQVEVGVPAVPGTPSGHEGKPAAMRRKSSVVGAGTRRKTLAGDVPASRRQSVAVPKRAKILVLNSQLNNGVAQFSVAFAEDADPGDYVLQVSVTDTVFRLKPGDEAVVASPPITAVVGIHVVRQC